MREPGATARRAALLIFARGEKRETNPVSSFSPSEAAGISSPKARSFPPAGAPGGGFWDYPEERVLAGCAAAVEEGFLARPGDRKMTCLSHSC